LIKGLALVPRILDLFDQLERDRPDVVHIYWGHYPAIFGWMVLEHARQVIVSLSLSAYDLLCDFPGSIAVARRAHIVSTWAAANVGAIRTRGLTCRNVDVVCQGLDLAKVRAHQFAKRSRRIVTAGRLVREKGIDDVIRAFARVAVAYPDANLLILGDGPDRHRLEELAATLDISSVVTFRGHVSHDEVFQELARAELFLFLSRYAAERLPNVVKEAMACRCLVVTTATAGIEELMRHGTHGWIVPLGEWEQAADWVIEAFANPETTTLMAQAAQHYVMDKFDLQQLMMARIGKWEEQKAALTFQSAATASDSLHCANLAASDARLTRQP
jgi:glycosyltransferase involved in cell wall biosynthesis